MNINKENKDYLIGQFITGHLSDDEKLEFDKLIEEEDFKENVQFQKELQEILNSDSQQHYNKFRNTIEKLGDEFSQTDSQSSETSNNWYYKIAASLIILVVLTVSVYFLLNTPEKHLQAYNSYFEKYELPGGVRSDGGEVSQEQALISQGKKYYKSSEYKEAIHKFEDALALNPGRMDLLFYNAIAYLNMNAFVEAESRLKELIEKPSHPFVLQSKWYLALIYIHENEIEKARPILEGLRNSNSIYQSKATELLLRFE